MSIIFKVFAVLTIFLSFSTIQSNGYAINVVEVFTLAEKLSNLFKAISDTKISLQEQHDIFKFQSSLMSAWGNLIKALNSIDSSKAIDVYIALIRNQNELVNQLMSVINTDQLLKFSQTIANTIESVNENENSTNCNSTGCEINFPQNGTNIVSNQTTTTAAPIFSTTLPQNVTFNPNGTINSTTTSQPSNFTSTTSSTTLFQNSTLINTNVTTVTTSLNNTTTNSPNATTFTSFPNTTLTHPNSTSFSQNITQVSTTSFSSNFTTQGVNFTTQGVNFTTQGVNFTSSYPNSTIATIPITTTASISSAQNQVYIDSEFCQFYSLVDCASRIEISLLCPAMCRCSKYNCKNNGTLALSDDGLCKCLCRPDFTGDHCDEPVCTEKEYCSYFNDSYCTVTMIEDNCPKLCGTCKK